MATKSSQSSADGIAFAITAVLTIVLIVPWLLIKGIVFISKKITNRSQRVDMYKLDSKTMQALAEDDARRRQENLPKVQELIRKTNDNLDRYEQQIANGQDKYQIGRAIGRLSYEFQKEYCKLNGRTYSQEGVNKDIDTIAERIDAIGNSDIQIENGMADYHDEQNSILDEQRKQRSIQEAEERREREREKREQERLVELKKQTELKERIAANSKCAGCRRKDTCLKINNKYCGGPF